MSYAIENLKFTIFGHGHDVTRNDSGQGVVNKELDLTVYSAVIDSSGAFAWLVNDNGLKKYSTRSWTEVEQTTIPSNCLFVYHPSNISNNYALATNSDGTTAYVFDMTDDALIATISGTFRTGIYAADDDCILVNNKIYIINRHWGSNANDHLWVFDIDNETFDDSVLIGGVGCNGFINDSLIFANYTREWFYQTSTAYAINFSGSSVWSNTGADRNDYLVAWGFTGNGYLYLPVLIDDKWHWGVFDGTSNPTFSPVSPIRYFGTFDSAPSLVPYIGGNNRDIYMTYIDGRTKGCALTSLGVIFTDFTDVYVIADKNIIPLAMNDDIVICSDYYNHKLYIYGY